MPGRFSALNIVLLATVLMPAPGAAEIRKRVDEHGQVHYEDAPAGSGVRQAAPAGADKPTLTSEQERLERQKRVLEAMESERRNKQQQRQELERRRNAGYLYRKRGDGEKEIFSDEEHARAIADAEAAVKKWCQ
jgi:hypothetical protein